MKAPKFETIDITPNKSIFHKIGEANYSVPDAIAELVDNSIDAANEDGVEIIIALDRKNNEITISDDGVGMSKEIATKALVLAESVKQNSLGEFGLGLKSACTSLGKKFVLNTTPESSAERYTLTYDKDEFMNSGDWKKFPIEVSSVGKREHGTTIRITSLRVKLYDALVTRLKKDLSLRYGPFIENNNVVIKVGTSSTSAKPCKPEPVELDENGKSEFEFVLPGGQKVSGWWGLMRVASGVRSGFNLFRRGRLIRASEKLGYNPHPMNNHIVGEIHLNPVPVTHNKREFITESGEFRNFIENFWGDKTNKLIGERVKGLIDEILDEAHKRWNEEKVEKQLPEKARETVKDNVLRALNRVEEFKELAFPELKVQQRRSDEGEELPIEQRESQTKVASEEDLPEDDKNDNKDKRTPSKTQPKKAKFVVINGKKFRFEFYFHDLGNDLVDKEVVVGDSGVEVYINTGFKGFNFQKDTNFYCVLHLSEALAQLYVKELKMSPDSVFELRNKLMYEVASVVLEEEELKRLTKQEEDLERVRRERTELLERSEASKL